MVLQYAMFCQLAWWLFGPLGLMSCVLLQAEECLSVLPNSRAINEQYRAIQGYRLLPDFGITMSPAEFLQVMHT